MKIDEYIECNNCNDVEYWNKYFYDGSTYYWSYINNYTIDWSSDSNPKFVNLTNKYSDITIKLVRTNDINIQKIVGGLIKNQKCFLKYDTKGIKVYVNQLIFNNNKRKIVINDDVFIGFIPNEYIKYLRKNKKNIYNIVINKIADKKYKKQKSIIIKITINDK